MALNSSGAISLAGSTSGQSIALELSLGATTQISLNDAGVRTLAGISTGAISLSSFYGKSNIPGWAYLYLSNVTTTPYNNIAEKVTFATNTYTSAGINVTQVVANAGRLSDASKAILVGGTTTGGSSKRATCYGVYFATATSFAVANQANLRVAGASRTTGSIGYHFQGIDTAGEPQVDTTQWNLSTLTQTSVARLLFNDGSGHYLSGETKDYAPGWYISVGNGPLIENRHTYATNVRTTSASTTTLGYGTMSHWRSLTKNYLFVTFVGGSYNRAISTDNATTTVTAINSLSFGFTNTPAGGTSGSKPNRGGTNYNSVANSDKYYFMGAYNANGTVAYNLGYWAAFATNTWTAGIARNTAVVTNSANCMGVDPFIAPTV